MRVAPRPRTVELYRYIQVLGQDHLDLKCDDLAAVPARVVVQIGEPQALAAPSAQGSGEQLAINPSEQAG